MKNRSIFSPDDIYHSQSFKMITPRQCTPDTKGSVSAKLLTELYSKQIFRIKLCNNFYWSIAKNAKQNSKFLKMHNGKQIEQPNRWLPKNKHSFTRPEIFTPD